MTKSGLAFVLLTTNACDTSHQQAYFVDLLTLLINGCPLETQQSIDAMAWLPQQPF
jgi:hypothetical protein